MHGLTLKSIKHLMSYVLKWESAGNQLIVNM